MKFGLIYPTMEAAGDPDLIRRFIEGAEALRFDYVIHFDHVLKASHADRQPALTGPFTEKNTFDDPFVFFAFAAAFSQRLEFATGVLVLPQRQTALVAQQAAGVDLLSHERLRLGVGVGWNHVEYLGLGQDFHTRGARLDEQIGLLRELWSNPLVDFEGRFDRISRACINPRPKRPIPIWVGGQAEAAFRRAALLGDGFIFSGNGTSALAELARVRHYLAQSGRSEQGFGFELMAHGANRHAVVDTLKDWRSAGGTHACTNSMNHGFGKNIDAHLEYAAEIREALGISPETRHLSL